MPRRISLSSPITRRTRLGTPSRDTATSWGSRTGSIRFTMIARSHPVWRGDIRLPVADRNGMGIRLPSPELSTRRGTISFSVAAALTATPSIAGRISASQFRRSRGSMASASERYRRSGCLAGSTDGCLKLLCPAFRAESGTSDCEDTFTSVRSDNSENRGIRSSCSWLNMLNKGLKKWSRGTLFKIVGYSAAEGNWIYMNVSRTESCTHFEKLDRSNG
jgi:hypothetical protein